MSEEYRRAALDYLSSSSHWASKVSLVDIFADAFRWLDAQRAGEIAELKAEIERLKGQLAAAMNFVPDPDKEASR